jgi:glycosyltransferase involved in cell wall biosynthesis
MLERLIEQSGTGARLRLERRGIPQPELRDLYAGSDVAVFPNRAQAYGLAPLESLASGTPVILSTGIGVSEPLTGHSGVLMVPPETPDAIAAALRTAMTSDLRSGVGETREWMRAELSNRRYAERMAAIFESLR